MIVGRTFDNQNVSAKADAGLYQAILKDGILWGCGISYTASSISIESGQMIVRGRVIGIDGVTQIDASGIISEGFGRVVLTINLNNASTDESFTQVTLSMEYSTTDVFTELTQEDINNTGAIYQQEIAVFTIAGGSITGISSTIGDIYAITNRGGEINGEIVVNEKIIANSGISLEHGQLKIPAGPYGLADGNGANLLYQIASGIQIGGTTAEGGGRAGETSINSQGGLRVRNGGIVSAGSMTVASGGANITGGLVLADNDTNTLKSPYWVSTDATTSPNAIFDGAGGLRRTSGSSRRYKRNIEDLPEEVVERVLNLRPVQFEFKLDEQGKKRMGFIAEEAYEVAPEVADYETLEDGTIQCNNVRYGEITAALLYVVKKQQEEIEAIKQQLKG